MTITSKTALAAFCCLAFALAGCGSDGDSADAADETDAAAAGGDSGSAEDSDEAGEGSGDEPGDTDGEDESAGGDAGPLPEECPAVGVFDGTMERDAEPATGHTAVSIDGAAASEVIASEIFGLYSLYIADHAIDRGPLDEVLGGTMSSDNPVLAADGGTVATIGFGDVQGGGRLAPGDELTTGDYQVTVAVDSGGGYTLSAGESDGSVEVLHVDDASVCVTIDYSDQQVSLSGTVHAPLYDGTN